MEMPEDLRELVDRLGQALVQALTVDPQCRDLARQIQATGYDIGLIIEATVALHRREETEGKAPEAGIEEPVWFTASEPRPGNSDPSADPQWSEDDKAFLKTFKISLD